MRHFSMLALMLWAASSAGAVTIIFKDGSMIEGEIIRETETRLTIKTLFDSRTVLRRDIDKIYEEGGEKSSTFASSTFEELPAAVRDLLNARADYRLTRYQRVLDRLEPFVNGNREDVPGTLDDMRWLVIQANERLARWDAAEKMLREFSSQEGGVDKLRADAHLAIFKDNPRYDLRVVGKSFSRNWLPTKLLELSREPDSLKNVELMDAALREYCSQLVRSEDSSIEAFNRRLDLDATLKAVQELPRFVRIEDFVSKMPYYTDLRRAETAILKAQAVLPGYADAFELDLIRAEGEHLQRVLEQLLVEAIGLSPFNINLPRNAQGQYTADQRKAWREACQTFLDRTARSEAVGEYFLEKIGRFPKELSLLRKVIGDTHERLVEMRQAVTRRMELRD